MTKPYIFLLLQEFVSGLFWSFWVEALLSTHGSESFSGTAFAVAAWFLSIAVFELPTGIIADRFGRKLSTLIGMSGLAICYFLLSFQLESWTSVIVGFGGLSMTFVSGASTAWLYGLFKEKRSAKTEVFFANTQLFGRIAMIAGAFAGAAALQQGGARYLWLLCALIAGVAVILGLGIPAEKKSEHDGQSISLTKVITSLKPASFLFFAATIFFGVESGLRNLVYQPFIMKLGGGSPFVIAFFQASLAGGRLISAAIYRRNANRGSVNRLKHLVLPLALFSIVQIIFSASENIFVFSIPYALCVAGLSWFFPARESLLNKTATDELRASYLSLDSLCLNLASGLICLVASYQMDIAHLNQAWIYGGIAGFVGALIYGLAFKKHQESQHSPV